ncbi:hypothetical protein BC826DRAFT_1054723 [Russula brevipes]|nr:hypothetical protein BC826DRAFT_1054723 [Russula brevipes]
MPDSIKTPDALVKEFKKSGEFDRLRRELLAQFQNEDGTEAFWARVDDIARTRLDAEDKLHLKAADTLHRELLQELDRFPLVERAVADVPALADPEFAAGIRRHAESLVRRSRGIPAEEDVSRGNDGARGGGDERDGRRNGNGASSHGGTRDHEGMEISDADG